MGIQLKIDYRYFNAMVFTIVGGFLFLCGCIQCIIFRNRFEPAMQFFKHFQYALFLELLLLAITDRLEIAEGIVCIISIDAIEMILLLFEKWQKKQEKKQNNNHTKESDFPNIDLFPTRCRQLDCFIPILKQQKDEPYSLMISAEWGMGKSSFVKALALDYRMSKDHFVWIMAGSEKSVSEIMLEISEQIIKILRENNIFIEKEHSIENYFLAFSGLLEEAGVELWGKVSHMLGIGSERNARNQQYLNNKLKKLNSTIYLIIDDLDRCEPEYRSKMFKVIRESTDLVNCKTLFLADKTLFHTDKTDSSTEDFPFDYMEKYISYTLYLHPVSYDEISDFYLSEIFTEAAVMEFSDLILNGRSPVAVRSQVHLFPQNVLHNLNYQKENQKLPLEDIAAITSQIQNNLTNPRKVKNYFKDIKRNLRKLSSGISQISMEYLREDWMNAVFTVSFLKNILPERYSHVQSCTDIYTYFQKNNDVIINAIMEISPCKPSMPGRRAEILNYIMFRLDTLDFSERKALERRYRKELLEKNIILNHVKAYCEITQSYEDYEEILNAYAKTNYKTESEKNTFIEVLMDKLSAPFTSLKANTPEFLEFSRKLIKVLTMDLWTEYQRQFCITEGEKIMRKAILESLPSFKSLLYLFFNNILVDTVWQKHEIIDIDSLFIVLCEIDTNSKFIVQPDHESAMQKVELFYRNMKMELKKANTSTETYFQKITLSLEIYKFWEHTIQSLSQITDSANPYIKYFNFQGDPTPKNSIFDNTGTLSEALNILVYSSAGNNNSFAPKLTYIFSNIMHRLVELYEQNPAWFNDGITETGILLQQINQLADKVCQNSSKTQVDSDIIDEIRILVIKFNSLYKTHNANK
ncbi:MAG: KAP family NTPase [Blautia sp.]|nr:KAP family NTPase [Blautia sp.]